MMKILGEIAFLLLILVNICFGGSSQSSSSSSSSSFSPERYGRWESSSQGECDDGLVIEMDHVQVPMADSGFYEFIGVVHMAITFTIRCPDETYRPFTTELYDDTGVQQRWGKYRNSLNLQNKSFGFPRTLNWLKSSGKLNAAGEYGLLTYNCQHYAYQVFNAVSCII